MKFYIGLLFKNLFEKIQVSLKNLTRITGTLHGDLCTFMMVSHRILRMRNVSDKNCTENQNIHCMFNNLFL